MVICDFSLYWIYSILVICLIALAALFRVRQLAKIKRCLSSPGNRAKLFPGVVSGPRAMLRGLLFIIGLFALILAFAQPRWGKKPQQVLSQGRNVLFVLDMSRSMLAADLPPNRLSFAKMKIRRLVQCLGPERVGLVLFSDKAFLHCPFTTDTGAFVNFLDIAEKVTISSGGTNLAAALDQAKFAFESIGFSKDCQSKNKVVIILSDGEDFSKDFQNALNRAKNSQINVLFLGAATEQGAPVPVLNKQGQVSGHQTDGVGQVVITKLDKTFIERVSTALEGKAIVITSTDEDIDQIRAFIEKYEKEVFSRNKFDLYEERQSIFSGIFFLTWVLRWLF